MIPPIDKLSNLKAAFSKYREALVVRRDELHRDGAIQRFEYTLELAWKALKRELFDRGVEANSPKEVFRLSAREKLIAGTARLFDYLEKRNLASRVYREDYAKTIEEIFDDFESDISALIANLERPPA